MKTWSDVFSSCAAGTPGAVCRIDGDISAAFPLCARAGAAMQADTDRSKKDGRNLIDMLLSQSVRR